MDGRGFAVLFTVMFAVGTVPLLLAQPTGAASASITGGFMLPIEKPCHTAFFIAIGIFAAWLAADAMILVPVSAALMLAIGSMMQIDPHSLTAMNDFIVGAILLFAFSVSMLRNGALMLFISPAAIWAYFTGGAYMNDMQSAEPLYFLQGILVSALLLMAIGVCIGVTLTESVQEAMQKLRHLRPVTSFLALF